MQIVIKENNKLRFFIWLPSHPTILNLILKVAVIDGKKFSKETRKKLIMGYKNLKKLHKPLVLIDIDSASGEKVLIKI
jgi:hypothetical protein